MVNKKYIIKKGDSGLYTIYRKNEAGYTYKMACTHQDIAEQVCHLLNLEAIALDGMYQSWKEVHDELEEVKREFFEYRRKHPEDE